jgi:nonsense-mediated mRNA decay protein 3
VPPNAWVYCELESRELLTFCLKRIKGMNKVKLIDAGFVWTEPHSRRLKVKITVQKEVFTSTILQQVFVIEFVVQMMQCPACAASFTDHTWQAVVQARQKVDHKRTFLYLEQLILKHSAHTNTIRIKEMPDGLDFYFGHRSHAAKFVDFLQAVTPLRCACRHTHTHAHHKHTHRA